MVLFASKREKLNKDNETGINVSFLQVAENKIVTVKFVRFQLEYDAGCDYDSVTLYDGISSSSPELAKLCGDELPKDISSSSNTLHIKYASSLWYCSFS